MLNREFNLDFRRSAISAAALILPNLIQLSLIQPSLIQPSLILPNCSRDSTHQGGI
jgi:hypothetical protein